jgi:hypothetical protein
MIYSNAIEIPDLCPLYFDSVREPIYFYKQDNYIPKMIQNTKLIIWIDATTYASGDDCVLYLYDGKRRDVSFNFTKHVLSGYDESLNDPKEYYYIQTEIDIASFSEMIVSFEVWHGAIKLCDTGAYHIMPPFTDDLKVIQYTNRINDYNSLFVIDGDTVFYSITLECGFNVNDFKVEGRTKSFKTQLGYDKLLSAMPVDVETFIIGDVYGVPNWMGSLMARIFCLSTIAIDGEEFSKFGDSELERVNSNGGLSQYKIEIQSKNTGTTKIFDNTHSYQFE